MVERIVRLPEIRKTLGVSRSAIYSAIKTRRFPRPIRLSTRSVGWRESEIVAVLDAIVAGADDDALRALVARLEIDRRSAA